MRTGRHHAGEGTATGLGWVATADEGVWLRLTAGARLSAACPLVTRSFLARCPLRGLGVERSDTPTNQKRPQALKCGTEGVATG